MNHENVRAPYVLQYLVTDLGVFKKLRDAETFTLTKVTNVSSARGIEGQMLKIKETCGWELDFDNVLDEVFPPTSEELGILRSLDPKRFFIGKT